MGLSGNLKTVAFPDILQLLATGKKTGVLDCATGSRRKEVAFKKGNIVFAASINTTEDMLGQMLLRKGKISKTDLDRALVLQKQSGRQLGTTLIDMQLFTKEEVAECLKLQIEEIVYNLFAWPEGEFVFRENETPKNAPFLIELNTMNVIMEGTRRIDEWVEIQKILPKDNVLLRVARSPKLPRDEITLSLDEFKLLSLINGDRTMSDLVAESVMGEFVACRALYKLILNKLVEVAGAREDDSAEREDEEEAILSIIFNLYSRCFHKVQLGVKEVLGDQNRRAQQFASPRREGLMSFFPGVDPASELLPSFEQFLKAVRAEPFATRYHALMSALERLLSEQLVYVYRLLGAAAYRDTVSSIKKEISSPLAVRRDLVKRYDLENSFYGTINRADKVVKIARG